MLDNGQALFSAAKGKGDCFLLSVQAKENIIVWVALIYDMCIGVSLWRGRKALRMVDAVLPDIQSGGNQQTVIMFQDTGKHLEVGCFYLLQKLLPGNMLAAVHITFEKKARKDGSRVLK